jgi:hypothetical protein
VKIQCNVSSYLEYHLSHLSSSLIDADSLFKLELKQFSINQTDKCVEDVIEQNYDG